MIQLGRRARLAFKPFDEILVVRDLRRKDLDGHRTFECEIFGEEHRTHPTPPNHLADLVPPLEGLREARDQFVGPLNRARPRPRPRAGI